MSLLTDALGIAHGVTDSLGLQATVLFQRYQGSDGYGTENYSTAVSLKAVVEQKQQSVKSPSGEMAQSTATVTFLDIPALLAATPVVSGISLLGYVFTKDRIVLPNGLSQPILNVGGFVDGGSGRVIPTEVYLA